ncbi:LysM peptidoglycan-binding domain-containing protein [Phocoenobacter skyensis]|uniref:Lipoprotein NlpD n=1 Tax=Phocoenobacter skyensis TaxID=97481 RepID=A0A1H7V2Z3_9PAST|nr:LysM peptidoglycan-binding domain-containing protein [Pasteurella skyensis]MDP8078473.1 LysM peptidoglycan-binding domain-containing protein [Pasteurella skyensis]MDP8084435.1 LysM peptidoglycan-binding domain-containing protein [Pasteurella skyensis]MDP8170423.1 LysM peptidoglycan-binding domain-containing protein [Pasteurella skyensis]MDP8175042.1 LysM peptidoglycan-binding domain-containing protein [Pasteurella skyensis]MDP8184766.1 LysM peptidoglycan-binding domain-containing protein [P
MKKLFLLFPMTALTLAGCSTYSPAMEDEDVLPPPPPAIETTNVGWQNTETTVYTPTQVESPIYQEETTPATSVSQNTQTITIPRDAEGRPDYSQMTKGSYTGSTYTVQKGDTLFLISYLSGQDVNTLARLNNLNQTYSLTIGQVLKLR